MKINKYTSALCYSEKKNLQLQYHDVSVAVTEFHRNVFVKNASYQYIHTLFNVDQLSSTHNYTM